MELTLEDIKKELKEYYTNQTIINEYERANGKIEALYDQATKTTTILSDMPRGSSKVQDKSAECIAEIIDLQRENANLEIEYAVGLMKLKNQNLIVHQTIMKLRSPLNAILIHIYENNKTREEAAELLGKSKKWLDTLIGHSLVEYLKLRNQNIKKNGGSTNDG